MMSVCLFLLASAVAPAAQEPAVQSTTTVNVLVTDRRGNPLRSARVVVNGSEHVGVTNNSGRVVFTNVKTGEYTLRVERNQYITFEKDFDVRDETMDMDQDDMDSDDSDSDADDTDADDTDSSDADTDAEDPS